MINMNTPLTVTGRKGHYAAGYAVGYNLTSYPREKKINDFSRQYANGNRDAMSDSRGPEFTAAEFRRGMVAGADAWKAVGY